MNGIRWFGPLTIFVAEPLCCDLHLSKSKAGFLISCSRTVPPAFGFDFAVHYRSISLWHVEASCIRVRMELNSWNRSAKQRSQAADWNLWEGKRLPNQLRGETHDAQKSDCCIRAAHILLQHGRAEGRQRRRQRRGACDGSR